MTKNPYALAWGAEIKARRQMRGMSRTDLAAELEVTPTMVGFWEQGRHAPSAHAQAKLMRLLMIDPHTLAKLIQSGEVA